MMVRDRHGYCGSLIEYVANPSCKFQWPWVTLKGGTREVRFFWRIWFLVWSRMVKFGVITGGEKCVSKWSTMPHPDSWRSGLNNPKILGTSVVCAHTIWETATNFTWWSNYTVSRKKVSKRLFSCNFKILFRNFHHIWHVATAINAEQHALEPSTSQFHIYYLVLRDRIVTK